MSQIASDAKISSAMTALGMTAPLPNLDDSQVLKAVLVALGNVTTGGGGGGTGNVVGPASSTNGDIAVFSGTTGKLLADGAALTAKLNGIEAGADVTDAANVGPAIGGATVITTLGDTDQIPVVQSNVLKSLAYSALKTLLGAIYQAKATILGTLGSLANAPGYLKNDGAGGLSWSTPSGGSSGYIVKTANYTAIAGDKIAADISGGTFTITLPAAPSDGDEVNIVPAGGSFAATNLTVGRNGENINGVAANLVLTGTAGVTLVYTTAFGWITRNPSIRAGSSTIPGLKPDGNYYGHLFFPSTLTDVAIGRYDQGATYVSFAQSYTVLNATNALGWSSGDPLAAGADTLIARISAGVNALLGNGWSGGILEMLQVASAGTPSANSGRIYTKDVAGTAEWFVMDEAGNETQISPHNASAPAQLFDSPFDEIKTTCNYYTGIIWHKNTQRQLAGRPDAQVIETFEECLARLGADCDPMIAAGTWDWDAVQAGHVAKSVEARADWASRKTEWEANPKNQDKPFPEEQPKLVVAKPMPKTLTDQLAGKVEFLAQREASGTTVSKTSMLLAMAERGFYDPNDHTTGLLAAIASMSDPAQKAAMQIYFTSETVVKRFNPVVLGLQAALGLDDAAVDALFVAAKAKDNEP